MKGYSNIKFRTFMNTIHYPSLAVGCHYQIRKFPTKSNNPFYINPCNLPRAMERPVYAQFLSTSTQSSHEPYDKR